MQYCADIIAPRGGGEERGRRDIVSSGTYALGMEGGGGGKEAPLGLSLVCHIIHFQKENISRRVCVHISLY